MIPIENPFPGLRSFEPDEDHLFFGREAQTDELLRLLRTTRFLAVVGTSGSGKSSLVRSGLIPSLYGGAMSGAGSAWRVAILRPGGSPIANLADALVAPEALGAAPVPPDRDFLEASLVASRLGLVESVREARLLSGEHLLILADQFEELFRFRQSSQGARDEALHFVRLLLEAAGQREVPIYIALTMRSEYIGHCMRFPDLPEAINSGLYLVPRMTREELRSAIVGPIAVGGGQIELSLVHRLLNDVGDNPDQLPILQHALMRTWDHAKGRLDLQHYEDVGTMREALSRHADEAYKELDAKGKRIAETMFKALTEPGPDGRGVRRPVPVGDVCALTGATEADVLAVAEPFLRPGRSFLTLSKGTAPGADSTLDLSHESLIRLWGTLRGWMEQEAGFARQYMDLAGVAARHQAGKAEHLRDLDLEVALKWRERARPTAAWAQRYDPSYERAMSFLEESRKVQQEARSRRQVVRGIGVVFLALVSLTFFVLWQDAKKAKKDAERDRDKAFGGQRKAEDQERLARRFELESLGGVLETQVQEELALKQKKLAEDATAKEAEERERAEKAAEGETKARIAAEKATAGETEARILAEKAQENEKKQRIAAEDAVIVADTERKKAKKDQERAERLKNLEKARDLATQSLRLQQDKELPRAAILALQAYQLHRESRKGYEEDTKDYKGNSDFYRALHAALSRWSEQARAAENMKQGSGKGTAGPYVSGVWRLDSAVRALAFESDRTLRAGTEDGRILTLDGHILDLLFHGEQNEQIVPKGIRRFEGGVRSLALGPAGIFAAGSLGGSIVVAKSDVYEPLSKEANGVWGPVKALAFHRKGWIAAGGADGLVHLWPNRHAKEVQPPLDPDPERKNPFTALAFSQNGKKLAACSTDGLFLWKDFEKPDVQDITGSLGDKVRAVDLSDDGKLLAAGTVDGRVVLCDLSSSRIVCETPYLSHNGSAVHTVRFNATGSSLASAGSDGTVRLWDVENGPGQARLDDPPLTLSGHNSWVWSTDFSPDGKWLVSGSEDRTVRFWPTSLDFFVTELCDRLRAVKPAKSDGQSSTDVESVCPPRRAEDRGATP